MAENERLPATVNSAAVMEMGERGIQLRSMQDAFRFAKAVVASGLAPRGLNKPEAVLMAIQAGAELGFTPMRALAVMRVINGRAGPMTRAAKALIRQSRVLRENSGFKEWTEGEGDKLVAHIETWRKDEPEAQRTSFSWADAVTAKLAGKDTYRQYPQRMLMHRAAGFHFDDHFSEILMGMQTAEVLPDYPHENAPVVHAEIADTPAPVDADPLLGGGATATEPALPDVVFCGTCRHPIEEGQHSEHGPDGELLHAKCVVPPDPFSPEDPPAPEAAEDSGPSPDPSEAAPEPAPDPVPPAEPEKPKALTSPAQAKRLWVILGNRVKEVCPDQSSQELREITKGVIRNWLDTYGLESTSGLRRDQYDAVCAWAREWKPPAAEPSPQPAEVEPSSELPF